MLEIDILFTIFIKDCVLIGLYVRCSNKICKVDYDNFVAIVSIVFS